MEKVIILIPTHYNIFSENEKISVMQCRKVLSSYPIRFMIPETLAVENDLVCDGIGVEKVPADWFGSFDRYNRTSVKREFYERFLDYEYMMIYHLDAYVFSDQMEYFCGLGYDYYGAPWLDGQLTGYGKERVTVGNGGFALKKIRACLNMLDKKPFCGNNEDLYWGSCECDEFRVAPMDVALQFAFETDVRRCYLINDYKLPFGCHAWWKHDLDFWKPYIEKEGFQIQGTYICCAGGFAHWIGWELSESSLNKCTGLSEYADVKFCLWGAKTEGFECGYLLKRLKITDFEYIDSNPMFRNKKLWGKEIKEPISLRNHDSRTVVIITAKNYEEEICELMDRMDIRLPVLLYGEIKSKIILYIQKEMLKRIKEEL